MGTVGAATSDFNSVHKRKPKPLTAVLARVATLPRGF